MEILPRLTFVFVFVLVLVLSFPAVTVVHAQQWNGPANAKGTIWREGGIALGTEPTPGRGKPLIELKRPMSSGSELMFSARSTFQNLVNERLEIDDLRVYAGGARSKAGFFSGTTDFVVHRNAVIGAVKLTERMPGDYALLVGGKVLAEEVRIKLVQDWSDHVFEPAYPLKSLREVEEYVRVHRRLPDIPSAEEVGKSGIELGQMQSKLLQKIEELTLYVIEQQKTIEALQRKLTSWDDPRRSEPAETPR